MSMAIKMTNISDFPSQQAEKLQQHLLELDKQGKLLDYFKEQYQDLGKYNSLARYIKDNWETGGKKLFIEWTGIEVYKENRNSIKAAGVRLSEITKGSNRYFLWKCSTCGHEWVAMLYERVCRQRGCPECGHRKQSESGHKRGEPLDKWCDKQGEYGEKLKKEFMSKLKDGTPVTLGELSKGSHDKVWWKCSNCAYEYTAAPHTRTSKDRCGCPACGGTRLIKGVNDFETFCKEHSEFNNLLTEFMNEDEKGNKILPSEISKGNRLKKLKWKCSKCGYIWYATPNSRTSPYRTGCPHCAEYAFTSFPEQYIYHSIKQLFPDTLSRAKDPIHNFEYDIVIPSSRFCIEYSGYNWHKDNIEHDIEKEEHCKYNNVQFLQIYAHNGEIKDTDGNTAQDSYEKNQILYKVERDKALHIIQLQYIIEFILQEYSPEHTIEEIDFTLAEQQANKVMGKA